MPSCSALAAFSGLRLGELLALRWEDVDLEGAGDWSSIPRCRRAWRDRPRVGRRASYRLPTRPRTRWGGFAPRGHYTERNDYVFCSRLGRRLDASAVRRRFKRARDAAGLRPVRFHGLRHGAGSLVARHADARFVQQFLGDSRLTTTERYMHAKARPRMSSASTGRSPVKRQALPTMSQPFAADRSSAASTAAPARAGPSRQPLAHVERIGRLTAAGRDRDQVVPWALGRPLRGRERAALPTGVEHAMKGLVRG